MRDLLIITSIFHRIDYEGIRFLEFARLNSQLLQRKYYETKVNITRRACFITRRALEQGHQYLMTLACFFLYYEAPARDSSAH